MRTKQHLITIGLGIVWLSIGGLLLTLPGCQGEQARVGGHPQAAVSSEAVSSAEPGAAELWAHNCQHCHNSRSPASYSDAQWEVAMLHMRVQASLTASEHSAILEFLKAGN